MNELPLSFKTKLLNIWFYTEAEPLTQEQVKDSSTWMRFPMDIVDHIMHGVDNVYGHPKINEIVQLMKDYCMIEEDKTIMELYFEGRVRNATEWGEAFNSPEVISAFEGLAKVLGDLAKPMAEKINKQKEEIYTRDRVSELARLKININ